MEFDTANSLVYEAKSPAGRVYVLVARSGDRCMATTLISVGSEGLAWLQGQEEGPFGSPDEACRCLSHQFDWFYNNGIDMNEVEFCENTLKAIGLA